MPFIIVSSSAKECSRPPKSSICQLAPAPSISASRASRSALGATGSLVPWITKTAALMSPSPFNAIGAHRHHPLLRGWRAFAGLALAVHTSDKGNILVASHFLRSFDGVLGNAEPVRHHQQEWPSAAGLVIPLVIPYERAFARHAAGLIIDALDRHINLPGLRAVSLRHLVHHSKQ